MHTSHTALQGYFRAQKKHSREPTRQLILNPQSFPVM